MGKLNKGILGGFSGTVGTVIGGSWKGISYIRSLPTVSNTVPSPAQQEQRARFKTVMEFLKAFLPLIKLAIKNYGVQSTAFNKAFSLNYKNALQGSFPAFSINYSMVQLSNGDLQNVTAPSAVAAANGMVAFNWTNNAGIGLAKDTDNMILVAYCAELNQAVYTTTGAVRVDEAASLDCKQFSGRQVHTWISVMTEDDKDAAVSMYTGAVMVS